MTVADLAERMSWRELLLWAEYFNLRTEQQKKATAKATANAKGGRGRR